MRQLRTSGLMSGDGNRGGAFASTRARPRLYSLLSARAAQRVRTNPSLRVSIESFPRPPIVAMPTTADKPCLCTRRARYTPSSLPSLRLALPELRRGDDRAAKTYRSGTITVRFFRFLVGLQPAAVLGRAPARRYTGVPDPCRRASPASSRHALGSHFGIFQQSPPDLYGYSATHHLPTRYQSRIQSP